MNPIQKKYKKVNIKGEITGKTENLSYHSCTQHSAYIFYNPTK